MKRPLNKAAHHFYNQAGGLMNYTVSILMVFFLAFIATLWIMSGACYLIHMNGYIVYYANIYVFC